MNITEKQQLDYSIKVLRRDPEGGYRVWSSDQIYLGKHVKPGMWVPNVGDKVDFYDGSVLKEKRVTAIDESTLIPTLEDISRPVVDNEFDVAFRGVGPALNAEAWRVFYDRNVNPHTLMCDSSFLVYGVEAGYIKLFKGTDTSAAGNVISMYRDSSEKPYTENVPLYSVSNRFDASSAVKRPQVCHTTEHLEKGQVITAVVYSDSGQQLYETRMLLADGTAVRRLDAEQAYIMGIELVSPFLSQSEDRLLEIPVNMTIAGVHMMARITYSDGSVQTMAIDQGRMALIPGLDHYIATRPGETGSFGLRYQLADNEHAWNSSTGENRHITEIYRYRTVEVDGSYTVMINVVPYYRRDTGAWDLRYFLHNLDRDTHLDVTDYIIQGVNSDIFNGRKYGAFQHLTVALQLEKLGLGLKSFRYAQQFDLGLTAPTSGTLSAYLLNYDNGQDISYGEFNVAAMAPQPNEIVLNFNAFSKANTVAEFLERSYYSAKPLYNQKVEARAPEPTHFIIKTIDGSFEEEHPISDFNANIRVATSALTLAANDTMVMTFLRKQGRSVFYLNTVGWQMRIGTAS